MKLNRLEFALMNNPARSAFQRHVEAPMLSRIGGIVKAGTVLEIGCGRGVGIETILKTFCADHVDAFDLDIRMVSRARQRLKCYGDRVRLWVGDASAIAAPSQTYDAVFDYGIIHHVPHWRDALSEVHRVLKPGGRFYGEEMLAGFITHPIARLLFDHPQADRFTITDLTTRMLEVGLQPLRHNHIGSLYAWFVASKPIV